MTEVLSLGKRNEKGQWKKGQRQKMIPGEEFRPIYNVSVKPEYFGNFSD